MPTNRGRFAAELSALLTAARWSAADEELVCATVERLDASDGGSWLREWTAAGGTAWATARRTGKAEPYLHAASYYRAALAGIDEGDGLVDELALWERQRACWDHAAALAGGQALRIPYETTTLPGHFFSGGPGRRPVVVIDHGGWMATSAAWSHGGAAAAARGYHWLTFDGPGREAAFHRQGLFLRPDWEAVLGPVTGAVVARADVDPRRAAVVGLGHAGFGIPRALAFDHRYGYAAVAPGIVDACTAWMDALPSRARTALHHGDRLGFDREVHIAELFAPGSVTEMRRRLRAYGPPGAPLWELCHRAAAERPDEERPPIRTPLLVCEPEEEMPWKGQSGQLVALAPDLSQLATSCTAGEAIEAWLAEIF